MFFSKIAFVYVHFLFLAKLLIKPIPIQRNTCRDETRSAPASSREMTLEKTEQRQMSSKIISSLASVEEASSSAILDKEEAALASCISDKNGKTSTGSTEQSPVISPTPVRTETPPPQASSSTTTSSQGIVGNIDLLGIDSVETSVSVAEAGPQPVRQITPLASTGPLTR